MVFWQQRAWGCAFFSGLLDLVAGYGYRPGAASITHVVMSGIFAFLYWRRWCHLSTNHPREQAED
jgi:hypothetical protein